MKNKLFKVGQTYSSEEFLAIVNAAVGPATNAEMHTCKGTFFWVKRHEGTQQLVLLVNCRSQRPAWSMVFMGDGTRYFEIGTVGHTLECAGYLSEIVPHGALRGDSALEKLSNWLQKECK